MTFAHAALKTLLTPSSTGAMRCAVLCGHADIRGIETPLQKANDPLFGFFVYFFY